MAHTVTQHATPDTGNKSVVVNIPDDRSKDDGEEKGITLKLHVYFDGTFGNKDNIDRINQAIQRLADKNKITGIKNPDIHDEKYKILSSKTGDKKYDPIDRDQYKKDVEAYNKTIEDNKNEIMAEADTRNKIGTASVSPLWGNLGKEKIYDPTKDDTSYTQVYTNIPIMFDMEKIQKKKEKGKNDSEKTINVYIEGVGTETGEEDSIIALAIGTDSTGMGIPSKINRAFEEIEEKADNIKIQNDNITAIEVCAIGFSRGSATTRNFVAEREKLVSTLKKINKSAAKAKLTYRFVGIFDTVCSVTNGFAIVNKFFSVTHSRYSIKDPQYNDEVTALQRKNIEDFKLAMRGNVKEVVHLTAADEYRAFFPLTNIQTFINAGCGYELVLPGSHCDLGGGDSALIPEKYEEKVMAGDENIIPNFLMNNKWFPPTKGVPITEHNPNKDTFMYSSGTSFLDPGVYTSPGYNVIGTEYKFEREVVVGYNRIPLAIMLHFAQKLGGIEHDENIKKNKTTVHEELEDLKNKFLSHVKNNHGHKRDTALTNLFEKEYQHLRHKFIHISVFEAGGMPIQLKNMSRTNKTALLWLTILQTFLYKQQGGGLCRAVFNDGDKGISFYELAARVGVKAIEEAWETVKEEVEEAANNLIDNTVGKLQEGWSQLENEILRRMKLPYF